nr:hypothetical protein BaRGS_013199 [Batillaria attramentaria]
MERGVVSKHITAYIRLRTLSLWKDDSLVVNWTDSAGQSGQDRYSNTDDEMITVAIPDAQEVTFRLDSGPATNGGDGFTVCFKSPVTDILGQIVDTKKKQGIIRSHKLYPWTYRNGQQLGNVTFISPNRRLTSLWISVRSLGILDTDYLFLSWKDNPNSDFSVRMVDPYNTTFATEDIESAILTFYADYRHHYSEVRGETKGFVLCYQCHTVCGNIPRFDRYGHTVCDNIPRFDRYGHTVCGNIPRFDRYGHIVCGSIPRFDRYGHIVWVQHPTF